MNALNSIDFYELLKKKNPYLFKAKNILTAQELILSFLNARLSSSEEEIFGKFLENLAVFVAQRTLDAHKSASTGVDLEYTKNGKRFLVTVKSGLNWGNADQWRALENNFKNAMKVLRQSKHIDEIQCVAGCCYGKARTTVKKGFVLQVCGQNFWYMLSRQETFYADIVEPLGYKAKELNADFQKKKAGLVNKFTKRLIDEFCDKTGQIRWDALVRFNSGNMTKGDRSLA